MSRMRKMGIAQAFDMIPLGGYIMMKQCEQEVMAEAERRNELRNGEHYSVVLCVDTLGRPQGMLVTRKESWASASDDRLLNLMRFAMKYVV